MAISTELTKLNTNILNAYTKVGEKGGTVPANKNTSNLPSAIDSIPTGGSASDEFVGLSNGTDRWDMAYMDTNTSDEYNVQAGTTSSEALRMKYYKCKQTNNIWPVADLRNSSDLTQGWWIRLRFKLWTDSEEGYPMAQTKIYFNGNHQFDLPSSTITTTPTIVDITFKYSKTDSFYEPILHLYPNVEAAGTKKLYISNVVYRTEGSGNAPSHDSYNKMPSSVLF